MSDGVVFMLDVDNTLLDNDAVIADLGQHLDASFGAGSAARYWAHFDGLREELGYADYLGALQRLRGDLDSGGAVAGRLLAMSSFLLDYPFAERLYPRARAVVAALARLGPTVILSDGDIVFQPRKVVRSGLWEAVGGRVMIFVHKEEMLRVVERDHPANHYVLVDDKPRILVTMKQLMGDRLTTVFPRQGHYARQPWPAGQPAADCSVEHIGDLLDLDLGALFTAPATESTP